MHNDNRRYWSVREFQRYFEALAHTYNHEAIGDPDRQDKIADEMIEVADDFYEVYPNWQKEHKVSHYD